jgi:hypothetical protein
MLTFRRHRSQQNLAEGPKYAWRNLVRPFLLHPAHRRTCHFVQLCGCHIRVAFPSVMLVNRSLISEPFDTYSSFLPSSLRPCLIWGVLHIILKTIRQANVIFINLLRLPRVCEASIIRRPCACIWPVERKLIEERMDKCVEKNILKFIRYSSRIVVERWRRTRDTGHCMVTKIRLECMSLVRRPTPFDVL